MILPTRKQIIWVMVLSLIYSGFVVFMCFQFYGKGWHDCWEWISDGIRIEKKESNFM